MSILSKLAAPFQVKQASSFIQAAMPDFRGVAGALIQPNDYARQVKAYISWVYICIKNNSQGVAAVPLRLYVQKKSTTKKMNFPSRKVDKGRLKFFDNQPHLAGYVSKAAELEEITEHPFLDLMRTVNPFMNRFDFKELTVCYLDLTGNSYWYIEETRLGTPEQLMIVPTPDMQIVPDEKMFIKGYIYKRGTREVAFKETEIIHFKYASPFSLWYGYSPLAAGAYAHNMNVRIKDWNVATFTNNAIPPGVLTTEVSLKDDSAMERLRREWYHLMGGVSNAGKIGILDKGLDFKPITLSPRELNYLKGMDNARDEIAAIYSNPKSLLTTDSVNRANAETGEYQLAKHAILSRCRLVEEKLNEKLLPRWDEKLFCAFDNPVPEDEEAEHKKRVDYVKENILTRDEVRSDLGKEELPDGLGSQLWMPINVMPIGGGEKQIEDFVGKVVDKVREKLNARTAS